MDGLAEYLDACRFKKEGKANAYVLQLNRGKLTLFINPKSLTLISDNEASGMNHHVKKIGCIKDTVELKRIVRNEILSFNSRLL